MTPFTRTPLNDTVDALHALCKATGGCQPGDEVAWRDGWPYPVCFRCEVPLGVVTWQRRYREGAA